MKKEALDKLKKTIAILEHDKKLGLATLKQAKEILRSKAGLLTKQKKLAALKQATDKRRKATLKQYSKLMATLQKKQKDLPAALRKKVTSLKKFYK